MNYRFKFENFGMTEDLVDDKGKILSYRDIYVCADTEENARTKAYRPKIDLDNTMLSSDWVLTNTKVLGVDWQS